MSQDGREEAELLEVTGNWLGEVKENNGHLVITQ